MQATHSSRRHASPAAGGGSCAPWKPTAPTTCPTVYPVDTLAKPCFKHYLLSLAQAWHGGFSSATAATLVWRRRRQRGPPAGPQRARQLMDRAGAHGRGGCWPGQCTASTHRAALKQATEPVWAVHRWRGTLWWRQRVTRSLERESKDRRERVRSEVAPAWGAAPPTAPPR